ncbi:hypothetical protein LZ31DRAFT_554917, partial [Colletotrichum somersetense]
MANQHGVRLQTPPPLVTGSAPSQYSSDPTQRLVINNPATITLPHLYRLSLAHHSRKAGYTTRRRRVPQ